MKNKLPLLSFDKESHGVIAETDFNLSTFTFKPKLLFQISNAVSDGDILKIIDTFNQFLDESPSRALNEIEALMRQEKMCSPERQEIIYNDFKSKYCENYEITGVFSLDDLSYSKIVDSIQDDKEKACNLLIHLSDDIKASEDRITALEKEKMREESKLGILNNGILHTLRHINETRVNLINDNKIIYIANYNGKASITYLDVYNGK